MPWASSLPAPGVACLPNTDWSTSIKSFSFPYLDAEPAASLTGIVETMDVSLTSASPCSRRQRLTMAIQLMRLKLAGDDPCKPYHAAWHFH
jgi:hypothetical protein